MKKKTIARAAAALMLVSCILGGCGNSAQQTAATTAAPETTAATTAVTEPPSRFAKDKGEMRGLTAKELVAEMKTGWNLGNSLDATSKDEVAWGNPRTTKEMIDMVHDKGFDVLRVPVTWFPRMDITDKIDGAFMDRVEEVVGYGLDNGMYVILNTHHEQDNWLVPNDANIEEVAATFKLIWEQISERFKDYGDHLIFEGLNEARVKGGKNEWNGGTQEVRDCVNRLNELFVNTVRASGGNNEKRLLLVTTTAQAVSDSAFKGMKIKYDDYTGYTLHAYTPYSFTYNNNEKYETFVWDGHEKHSIDGVFGVIDKYVLSEGVPVIITECGAEVKNYKDSDETNEKEVIAWTADFYGAAKSYGIPCVRWDNNIYNAKGEKFGLLDRNNLKWYNEELVDAIMDVYK